MSDAKEYGMQMFNGTPCIPWPGWKDHNGYGMVVVDGKRVRAHRAIYENTKGKIPHGLVLDHLCRNRWCVNPSHLEAVTNKENILRGFGQPAKNARKTHCKRGHLLSHENLRNVRPGVRECRLCHNAQKKNAKPAPKNLITQTQSQGKGPS